MSSVSNGGIEQFEDDPEIVAVDILLREGPEVERGHNGRAFVTQVQATTLARAYLDAAAEVLTLKEKISGT
jgi:hypothetical protein